MSGDTNVVPLAHSRDCLDVAVIKRGTQACSSAIRALLVTRAPASRLRKSSRVHTLIDGRPVCQEGDSIDHEHAEVFLFSGLFSAALVCSLLGGFILARRQLCWGGLFFTLASLPMCEVQGYGGRRLRGGASGGTRAGPGPPTTPESPTST